VVSAQQPSAIEKASQPLSSFGKSAEPQREEQEFKPRKKRRKIRIIPILLWLLFLLAAGVVGVVRFAPNLIPPELMKYVPVVLLLPTEAPLVVPTVVEATVTPIDSINN
jgi:hypothetical protein